MPELPEVQTVIDHLKPYLINQKITKVEIYYPPIVYHKDLNQMVEGKTIVDIKRRGKYICFILNDGNLVAHLRMEGKFYLQDKQDPLHKHTHVSFYFDRFRCDFNDTRKFGRIDYSDHCEHYFEDHLGLEPFDEACDASYLKPCAKQRRIPVKTFILDQSVIAGIGNIYSDESLFDAKISPFKAANKVTLAEYERLIHSIRRILNLALIEGGSTIRSFSVSHEINGLFQQRLQVYARVGQNCKVCGLQLNKGRVNGRSCVYCRNCQKVSEHAHRHYRIDGIGKK